jgi:hypothetical protein
MLRFSKFEYDQMTMLFEQEIKSFKVIIGKYRHPPVPVKTSDKKYNDIIEKYTLADMLYMLSTYESKYNYKFKSKAGDNEDLAKMIYNLYYDPFYYCTPFEILPKYTLFDLDNMNSKNILFVLKQFNINPNDLKNDESDIINLKYEITPIQRRNFILILKNMNKIVTE